MDKQNKILHNKLKDLLQVSINNKNIEIAKIKLEFIKLPFRIYYSL